MELWAYWTSGGIGKSKGIPYRHRGKIHFSGLYNSGNTHRTWPYFEVVQPSILRIAVVTFEIPHIHTMQHITMVCDPSYSS